MIARRDDHARALGESFQRIGQQPHTGYRRHGPIVDIAAHEDGIDCVLIHGLAEMINERPLVGVQIGAVECAADMPVGRVQDFHTATVVGTADTVGMYRAVVR